MRAAILLLVLLLPLVHCFFDLGNSDDSSLSNLLDNKWFDMLPEKVKSAKTTLLGLLQPASSGPQQSHQFTKIRNRHQLLK